MAWPYGPRSESGGFQRDLARACGTRKLRGGNARRFAARTRFVYLYLIAVAWLGPTGLAVRVAAFNVI